ncbi:MAG: hypothetical protein NVSMB12_09490 [Acidimicrobiales bacterium]
MAVADEHPTIIAAPSTASSTGARRRLSPHLRRNTVSIRPTHPRYGRLSRRRRGVAEPLIHLGGRSYTWNPAALRR